MIVLLDADGPLFDFTRGYLDAFAFETGIRVEVEAVDRWAIHECPFFADGALRLGVSVSKLRARVEKHVERPGFARELPIQPGAREAVMGLHALGAEVWVVTSPWRSSKTWVHERTERLVSEFGIDDGQIVNVGKKHRVFGHVFVDDKPSNVSEWQAAWPKGAGVLFDLHHNRGVDTQARGGWEDVLNLVRLTKGA